MNLVKANIASSSLGKKVVALATANTAIKAMMNLFILYKNKFSRI
jgi:hypothetical protein